VLIVASFIVGIVVGVVLTLAWACLPTDNIF
jgi:hypothetical protein